ncbi:MAG: trypsin-like peptidase domain-containing protein [Chloroflexi bacterium]|nr:trypsin-like peptidase domain-containing protein [Chloroflexota bacterium]
MSRALAFVLFGAIIGGIAGGATARYLGPGTGGEALPSSSASAGAATLAPAPSGVTTVTAGDVVGVVQELSPSVVTIINRVATGQEQSRGSGFLVDAQRGYVITNSHVVSNVRSTGVGASFDVIFEDGRKVAGRLVGRDPETDVAVLETGAQQVKPLVLGNSEQAPIGATVVAIGSALGEFRNSVTTGVLSGKGRRLPSQTNRDVFLEDLIQTDAAISPGNSGGPLIWAATKQVIGMNTLVIREAGSEGLGFAVSSNTVRQIADELIKSGRVERGRIGIAYTPLTARNAQVLGLPANTTGVQISDVVPGSPASSAGIRGGDVLTKVNDQSVDEEHPLLTIMLKYRPGDKVKLTLIRDGREQVVEVTLGRPT